MDNIMQNRDFMKCPDFKNPMAISDQTKGVKHPPHDLGLKNKAILLPAFDNKDIIINADYNKLLDTRRSVRTYDTDAPMTKEQLAYVLWSVGGIQFFRDPNQVSALRPTPSGGCRHPFNIYIAVKDVEGLEPGLYHHLPTENISEKRTTIQKLKEIEDYSQNITKAFASQAWTADAPVVLFITCSPYRSEWRYVTAAHRVMLIDLGHLGQNAMLSAVALGLDSCCLAAYNQECCDKLLSVDGIDEYMVYGISIGKALKK